MVRMFIAGCLRRVAIPFEFVAGTLEWLAIKIGWPVVVCAVCGEDTRDLDYHKLFCRFEMLRKAGLR